MEVSLSEIADAAGIPCNGMDRIVDDVRNRMQQCGEILAWGNSMHGAQSMAA